MVKLETWVALGSLAMAVMFVLLLNSFINFLIGPQGKGPDVFVDPNGVLIQVVSISGAPSLILAGTVFGLTKSYGTKNAAIILVVSGFIIIAGMSIAITLVPNIDDLYVTDGIKAVPYIFIISGLGVVGIGAYLAIKYRRHYPSLRDDLR